MFKPGLIYDSGFTDHLAFICDAAPGTLADPAATCGFLESLGFSTDASDLNLASIGIGEVAGSQTVTRFVTSVDENTPPIMYTADIEAPEGYEVTVMPESFKIRAGETVAYQVTITNVSAPVGEWRHGSITWNGGNYEVRSPISVRGVALGTPASVDGLGVDEAASVPVVFGYTGDYTANAHGLEASTVFEDTVVQDPDQMGIIVQQLKYGQLLSSGRGLAPASPFDDVPSIPRSRPTSPAIQMMNRPTGVTSARSSLTRLARAT